MWRQRISKTIIDKSVRNTNTSIALGSTNTARKDERQTHSTVDKAEVESFSKHTKVWWDLNGPYKMLHKMNLIRVPFVRDGLVQCAEDDRTLLPLKDKKILDVGCGGGILSEGLARIGANVTGIDASAELIEVAQSHSCVDPKIADNKPKYYNTTIEEHIKEFSNYYDGVVASEVIEHVNNPELFVKSCAQALRPGGRVFMTTPNRTRLAQCAVIFMAENILKIIPRGTHQYEKFITPNELTFMLERNDCLVEAVYGYSYNIITGEWKFTSFQQLGYAIQALKLK